MSHLDSVLLLSTEARIIAEDDTYAVIALRVEKAIFARNLPLLAALAQLMPEMSPKLSPEDSPPFPRRVA